MKEYLLTIVLTLASNLFMIPMFFNTNNLDKVSYRKQIDTGLIVIMSVDLGVFIGYTGRLLTDWLFYYPK